MTPWTQTYRDGAVDLLTPHPDTIDPVDIAHHLAHLCRYSGATRRHYSVAEHCILLHDWALLHHGEHVALKALLHDAHEAYCGDQSSPVKAALAEIEPATADAWRTLTDGIDYAIGLRFGLERDWWTDPLVREADLRIVLDERAALLGGPPRDWGIDVEPLGVHVSYFSMIDAEQQWLKRLRAHRGR